MCHLVLHRWCELDIFLKQYVRVHTINVHLSMQLIYLLFTLMFLTLSYKKRLDALVQLCFMKSRYKYNLLGRDTYIWLKTLSNKQFFETDLRNAWLTTYLVEVFFSGQLVFIWVHVLHYKNYRYDHELSLWFRLWCYSDTFNYIVMISWRSVLLVEESWLAGENRHGANHWQTLSHVV
jgi:hypothetical protein